MDNLTDTSFTPGDAPLNKVIAVFCVFNGVTILLETIVTTVTIWRTPSLNTNENIFVFSLAITDGVVGVTSFLYGILYHFMTRVPYLVFNGLVVLTWNMITVSVVHLALVAVDRSLYVVKPFFYERRITRKFASLEVLIAWTICTLVLASMSAVSVVKGELNNRFSEVNAVNTALLVSLAAFFVSSVIILASYVVIFRVALRQRRAISGVIQSVLGQHDGAAGENPEVSKHWGSVMKSVRFFMAVCGAFFACMMPLILCRFVNLFHRVPGEAISAGTALSMLNSTMNPIIYAVMNKQFCHACKKTWADFLKFVKSHITCCRC